LCKPNVFAVRVHCTECVVGHYIILESVHAEFVVGHILDPKYVCASNTQSLQYNVQDVIKSTKWRGFQVCTKLGWRGKGTRWDLLPLVLSANGHDPDYFDLPRELVLEVSLVHPSWVQTVMLYYNNNTLIHFS